MKNKLILIHGPSGVGKSTIANLIKIKLKPSVHLSVDSLKFTITDFRKEHEKAIKTVKEILPVLVSEYLKKNFNVILEYQISKKEILQFKKISQKRKANFYVFGIDATLEFLLDRIQKRQKTAGKKPPSIISIKKYYKKYQSVKIKDNEYFDAGKKSSKQIANKILKEIK